MSRRKKNAGKGFGMMFHGMFSSKADAKKKERKTKGAFMKRKAGRWLVMSPRTNPIKRKKKKVVTTSQNPHELLVMGANPVNPVNPAREFVVPPGSTITIRTNPSAEALREEFIGAPVEFVTATTEPHMPKGDYAKLGDLMGLAVKPMAGGQVLGIHFFHSNLSLQEAAKKLLPLVNAPSLVSDESARQLYFQGGRPEIEYHRFGARQRRDGLMELGEARMIVYRAKKSADDFDLMNYVHNFGEETGVRPLVLYDPKHARLLLEGGEYEVRREGIVN